MKFYIIRYLEHNEAGFFARFNQCMVHLIMMEELEKSIGEKLTPFVDYQNVVTWLRDPGNPTKNEWDYTFIQNYDIEEVYKSEHIMSDGCFHAIIPPQGKNFRNKQLVEKIHRLINEHIIVRPDVLSRVNEDVTKYKTLAVHCRRSDMHIGHSNIALQYTDDVFFKKAMKVFKEGGFEKIYLSTEEIAIADYFKEKMGGDVMIQDCYRLQRNGSTLADFNRPYHKTLVCKEVLADAIAMSKCHSLLCGISGVSNGAIYLNGLKYENVYYFDEISL
jgi:hypothetical protein